jgi:hypothetical protein
MTCIGNYTIKKVLLNNFIDFSAISIDLNENITFATYEFDVNINLKKIKSIILGI